MTQQIIQEILSIVIQITFIKRILFIFMEVSCEYTE
jgi:hypothetical protein